MSDAPVKGPSSAPRTARRVFGRADHSFSDTLLSLADLAPTFPPSIVAHGLELSHRLRQVVGDQPVEPTLWEELLALRRGPGTDAFVLSPLPRQARAARDLLLDRAVEIRALVDAVRNHRFLYGGQPLNRVVRRDRLRTRRVMISSEVVPVVVRLGGWFTVLSVADEHPRALRERILAALTDDARELGRLRQRQVVAPIVVALDPFPLGEALHLHRLGLEGPWLSWSETAGERTLGVLSAHHLVLEGPGLAGLRADFRQRVRAFRLALGLDAAEDDAWEFEHFSEKDAFPFEPFGSSVGDMRQALERWAAATESVSGPAPAGEGMSMQPDGRGVEHRHTFAHERGWRVEESQPSVSEPGPALASLPLPLRQLLASPPSAWTGWGYRRLATPTVSVRFATIHRGAFSLPDFCYAYCRAQHDAMAVHHPHYGGQGFTFVVPLLLEGERLRTGPGGRGRPILCSFHTRRGSPESAGTFKRRFIRRMEEADRGRDALSLVFRDVLRVAAPSFVKSAVVRLFESGLGDGGTFLGGRGLVSYIEVPSRMVDPVARNAGLFEGLFIGSCQRRGGVALSAIDRGYRRDLCAVGSGIFQNDIPMDLFWQRFAYFLGQAAM